MVQPNVIPFWWASAFIGLQAASLLTLTFQHVMDPLGMFLKAIPDGFDRDTDGIKGSLRIELAGTVNAGSYPMVMILLVGIILFACNSLHGQPKLQQRLVKLAVFTALGSDLWLYTTFATKLPSSILFNRAIWTPNIKGIFYGLPVATTLKLLWVFGIGRDKV